MRSSSLAHTHESVDGAAQHCVWNHCQNSGGQRGLHQFQPVPLNKLIDNIKGKGEDKDLGDSLPAAFEQVATLPRIGEEGPDVCVARFSRVPSSVTDGEQDRHQRLHEQPKVQWPVKTSDEIGHKGAEKGSPFRVQSDSALRSMQCRIECLHYPLRAAGTCALPAWCCPRTTKVPLPSRMLSVSVMARSLAEAFPLTVAVHARDTLRGFC